MVTTDYINDVARNVEHLGEDINNLMEVAIVCLGWLGDSEAKADEIRAGAVISGVKDILQLAADFALRISDPLLTFCPFTSTMTVPFERPRSRNRPSVIVVIFTPPDILY